LRPLECGSLLPLSSSLSIEDTTTRRSLLRRRALRSARPVLSAPFDFRVVFVLRVEARDFQSREHDAFCRAKEACNGAMGFSPGLLPLCGDVVLVLNFVRALRLCVSAVRAFVLPNLKFQMALLISSRKGAPLPIFSARPANFVIPTGASRRFFPRKSRLFDFRVGTRSRGLPAAGRDLSSSLSKTEDLNRAISNLKSLLPYLCLSVPARRRRGHLWFHTPLESLALQHRQPRILRKPRISRRQLAHPKLRPPIRLDPPPMNAFRAQPHPQIPRRLAHPVSLPPRSAGTP